jgi:hypothetical protein
VDTTIGAMVEVIQEGWFFIRINSNTKSLYECWYQIYSDGLLAFRLNTNEIIKCVICDIQFRLYDATSSLPTGCGMILSYERQEYSFIFDHILDLKRFCFGCYRTAQEGNNLQVCLHQFNTLAVSMSLPLCLLI